MKKQVSYAFDALALAGASAIVYGVAKVSVPAAWILGGLMALTFAIAATWKPKS